MKMPRRELGLLVTTLAVALLAATYLMLEPSIREFGAFGKKHEALEDRAERARRLLESRPQVEADVQAFMEELPVYPEGRKPDSTLMPALEKLAGDILTRREIGAEEPSETVRNLYETAITCHWAGGLQRVVEFLYAQQSQGVASDMRQLSIQTATTTGGGASKKDRLSGRFTVHYAYRRAASGDAPPSAATTTAPPPTGTP